MKPTQIRVEMARQGLTGLGLSRDLGFSVQAGYMNKIARGAMVCSTVTALKIAVALKVPMDVLFDREGVGTDGGAKYQGVGAKYRAKKAKKVDGVSGVEN